jgi:glycosyltransferase involved in cell wall biosynthesis
MNLPLVSILIPLYNSEKYITETIQSCLNQTYKNIEVIIVDDGSTDNSYQVAKSYESDILKVYKQENAGACRARNYAFELSSGDYIQYLDADDLLSPNKIEKQIELFEQYGDNIITSCQWGRFAGNKNTVKWEKQPIYCDYENPVQWLIDSWMGKGMGQTSIWLTPRHIIQQAGSWNENLLINQDGEFFCRVLLQAESIKFCENCGIYYRSELENSITQSNIKSYSKAESLLASYLSYERIRSIRNDEAVKKALGNNYLNFIYQYYSLFPDLSKKAEEYFYNLGFDKMWMVGGANFKRIANMIGFKNTLKLVKLMYRK